MNDRHPEPIPQERWLVAPWNTFRLYRRMAIFGPDGYLQALDQEKDRMIAIAKLKDRYGRRDWRHAVPRDLVWMLRKGVLLEEALPRVEELLKKS